MVKKMTKKKILLKEYDTQLRIGLALIPAKCKIFAVGTKKMLKKLTKR